MTINEKTLKITGKVELPLDKEIDYDQDLVVRCIGQLVKVEDGSNQDGTINRKYVVKISTAEIN